jgi:hypothetical protein
MLMVKPTYPCFHCAEWFESEGARNRHIAQAPMCKVALNTPLAQQPTGWVGSQRSAATEAEPPRQDKARKRVHFQTPDPPSSPHPADLAVRKYPKPWVEEVEDKESARRVPNAAWNEDNTAFVEFFPNVDAGAPISDDRTHEVDLHAYIQACGVLADPEHFEVAELLMTSGLTNSTRDRFLKSRLVSIVLLTVPAHTIAYRTECSLGVKPLGKIANKCLVISTSCPMVPNGTPMRWTSRSAPKCARNISLGAALFRSCES